MLVGLYQQVYCIPFVLSQRVFSYFFFSIPCEIFFPTFPTKLVLLLLLRFQYLPGIIFNYGKIPVFSVYSLNKFKWHTAFTAVYLTMFQYHLRLNFCFWMVHRVPGQENNNMHFDLPTNHCILQTSFRGRNKDFMLLFVFTLIP